VDERGPKGGFWTDTETASPALTNRPGRRQGSWGVAPTTKSDRSAPIRSAWLARIRAYSYVGGPFSRILCRDRRVRKSLLHASVATGPLPAHAKKSDFRRRRRATAPTLPEQPPPYSGGGIDSAALALTNLVRDGRSKGSGSHGRGHGQGEFSSDSAKSKASLSKKIGGGDRPPQSHHASL